MSFRSFGPYRALGPLGDGGTGIVMRCLDVRSQGLAAVKIPKGNESHLREALRREIAVLRRLNNARIGGVVRLLEHDSDDELPWYAMNVVTGESLHAWNTKHWALERAQSDSGSFLSSNYSHTVTHTVEMPASGAAIAPSLLRESGSERRSSGTSPPARSGAGKDAALRLLWRLLLTLHALHEHGIVHGDVTPRNVVVQSNDDPVLIDFGTAFVDVPANERARQFHEALGRGTPGYIAPEVIRGEPPDARSDLYAFGAVMHELLLGRPAFAAERPEEILREQLEPSAVSRAPWPSELHDLENIAAALLQRDPTRRPACAADVLDILKRHVPAEQTPDLGQLKPCLYRPRFVGREAPMAITREALDALEAGVGGLVLYDGAPGIGKTRFLYESRRAALELGFPVVWCGASRPSDGEAGVVPNESLHTVRPLLEWISNAFARQGQLTWSPEVLQDLQSLRAIVPWLPIGNDPEPTGSSTEAVPRALEALARLTVHLARPHALVVVLDDVEHSERTSLEFLRTQAAILKAGGVLFLGSIGHDASVESRQSLLALANTRAELPPLTAAEVTTLAKELLSTRLLPEGLAEVMLEHCDGNPTFIAECLRAALGDGALSRSPSRGWTFRPDALHAVTGQRALGEVLRTSLSALSGDARAALRVASVMGREFAPRCFEALAGASLDARATIEELVSRDVLTPTPDGHYRFVHDRMREAQLAAISPPERREIHRQLAEILETQTLTGTDERLALLGLHWSGAGEATKAIAYLEAAAAAAQSAHSLDRAAGLYRLALTLLDAPEQAPKRVQLGEALADVLLRLAHHQAARACLLRVVDELPVAQHVARARAFRKLATSHWTMHEYDAASGWLNRADAALGNGDAEQPQAYWDELVQARLGRFQQLYFAGQLGPELDRLVDDLGPLVESHGTPDQRCSYYFTAASHRLLRNRYAFDAEALALAQHGLRAAEERSANQLAMAQFVLAWTLMSGSREQWPLAIRHFALSTARAQPLGDATMLSRIRTYHAIALLRLGDIEGVERMSTLALESAETAQLQPYIGAAHACRGWAAWRRAALDEAIERCEDARAIWRAHPHKFPFSNIAVFPLLDIAEANADLAAAKELLAELAVGLPALPAALTSAAAAAWIAIDGSNEAEALSSIRSLMRTARAEGFA